MAVFDELMAFDELSIQTVWEFAKLTLPLEMRIKRETELQAFFATDETIGLLYLFRRRTTGEIAVRILIDEAHWMTQIFAQYPGNSALTQIAQARSVNKVRRESIRRKGEMMTLHLATIVDNDKILRSEFGQLDQVDEQQPSSAGRKTGPHRYDASDPKRKTGDFVLVFSESGDGATPRLVALPATPEMPPPRSRQPGSPAPSPNEPTNQRVNQSVNQSAGQSISQRVATATTSAVTPPLRPGAMSSSSGASRIQTSTVLRSGVMRSPMQASRSKAANSPNNRGMMLRRILSVIAIIIVAGMMIILIALQLAVFR